MHMKVTHVMSDKQISVQRVKGQDHSIFLKSGHELCAIIDDRNGLHHLLCMSLLPW